MRAGCRWAFLITLGLVFSAAGCRGKSSKPDKAASEPKAAVSVESLTMGNAPAAPGPAASSAAPPSGGSAIDAAIAEYNKALSKWIFEHDDVPVDLDYLKAKKGLPPLPAAPPGRKIILVVDRKSAANTHIELK
jgi:hypothetical protein